MIATKTFVGMPPFPVAAKKALANSQLRSNIRNATHTIRTKRARVVAELDDFEDLIRAYGIVEMQRTGRVALPMLDRADHRGHQADGTAPTTEMAG